MQPSEIPSKVPSTAPSSLPSLIPSLIPSQVPSTDPSITPSEIPSNSPSEIPSNAPSILPSEGWNQKGPTVKGAAANDNSGWSVSVSFDGSVVASGAPFKNLQTGEVRVYEWIDPNWSQRGSPIVGPTTGYHFGKSISLSYDGSLLAVGAPFGGGGARGRVKVYEWNTVSWIQKGGNIDGEGINDNSGTVSLSHDGSILAVGAHNSAGGGTSRGRVKVYEWDTVSWNQKGGNIDGEADSDSCGSVSLSWDGLTVAVGAGGNDGNGSNSGHVRVYYWDGGTWAQRGADIDGEAAGDYSGTVSLSSDGLTVAVGAGGNDGGGSDAGHVRVYEYTASWNQKGGDIDGQSAGDNFGSSVSLSADGNKLAVGAPGNDGNRANSGRVYVYAWSGNAWNPVGSNIDGVGARDKWGSSVSLSSDGTTVAAGAPWGGGSKQGHVRVFHQY